jgi:hypothetical protein
MRIKRIIPGILGACLIAMIIMCGCTNLQINSDPTGADVIIDGQKVGQTNYETTVDPGIHSIVLTKSGYETYQTQAPVSEDETTVIDAQLVSLTSEMRLISEKTINVRKNCYAYYRYKLGPGKKVSFQVIAPGDMYGFTTFQNDFDTYLRFVNGQEQWGSGLGTIYAQWGRNFEVIHSLGLGDTRRTFYFVLDNTQISNYLTYSPTLPSEGGSVLVRITTNDPQFTLEAESQQGCMPGGTT